MKRYLTCCLATLLFVASPAYPQQNEVMDRLSDLLDAGTGPVIVIFENAPSDSTGAAALIANRGAGIGAVAPGSAVLAGAGGGGLGYTCTGEGDSGKCTCGPNDPCIGMVDACRKLGGKTTTCDNQTKTCSCEY